MTTTSAKTQERHPGVPHPLGLLCSCPRLGPWLQMQRELWSQNSPCFSLCGGAVPHQLDHVRSAPGILDRLLCDLPAQELAPRHAWSCGQPNACPTKLISDYVEALLWWYVLTVEVSCWYTCLLRWQLHSNAYLCNAYLFSACIAYYILYTYILCAWQASHLLQTFPTFFNKIRWYCAELWQILQSNSTHIFEGMSCKFLMDLRVWLKHVKTC